MLCALILLYVPAPELEPESPKDCALQLKSERQDNVVEDDDIPLNEDSWHSRLSSVYRGFEHKVQVQEDMWLTA